MGFKTKVFTWLAWKLPRGLVYWCAIRVMTDADPSNKYPMEQTCGDVCKKWANGGNQATGGN